MKDNPQHSDLLLERYALGELSVEKMESLRQQLQQDAALQKRLEQLTSSNQQILDQYPAAQAVDAIQQKAVRATRRRRWYGFAVAAPALAAAALALFYVVPNNVDLQLESEVTERRKGLRPHLVIQRQHGQGSEYLNHQSPVQQGDLLQLGYVAAKREYGVVVSIDGRGEVTLHHPTKEEQAARLLSGGEILLPFAYELDDAPDFERFIFVTSNQPFVVAEIVAAAKQLASQQQARSGLLQLPADLWQDDLTLSKR